MAGSDSEQRTGRTPATRVATDVEVRPVRGRRELSAFITLPWRLYEDSANWVPPLISERRRHLDRAKNPFFEHAEAEYFLAWRGRTPVGRITAQVDRRFNEIQDNEWGMFGFLECENDAAIAAALLGAAERWLRGRGRDRMLGPLDFSTNHECGLLVEGHELAPQILENWHHPYYRPLLEGQGLTKAMDLYKWEIQTADRGSMLPVIEELADRLEPEHGITLRRMRKRQLSVDVKAFMDIYNAAWERNWGFVPLTDHELEHYASELAPVLDEDFGAVAETREGEVVGVSLSLPDYNQVLSKVNGRLLPLGWLRALRAKPHIDEVRVFALGVKPEYQHTGVAAALYRDIWDACERRRIKRVETGWILEVNEPMNRAMEALTGRIVKRYRLYEREL
ncbi:MAG TPA: GNAT family N-acetyltransferase [Solirubrobacteraceae bacterium]|jgi:GNAT superfamily N-acetyltransferase|nr:GNAT family N-acetyltransferase [Solirubrobacteraceae bacterium]